MPVAERIAVFDNDGTLWPENPMPFQLAYAVDEVKRLVAEQPALKEDPMVQALLAGDFAKLLEGPHHDGLLHIIALTHAGMTTEDFATRVETWIATAKHPKFGRPYDQLTYQPMQEVLRYLRANGFKTFIVSGGGADFMRVWSERVYGIPPEQVVGSTARVKYELRDTGPVLVKTLDHLFVDDKAGKPAGIHQFIGRRPIAAFGNSDGDKQMLEYTTISNPRPSLGVIVRHTDAEREYQYDVNPKSSGTLVEALKDAPAEGLDRGQHEGRLEGGVLRAVMRRASDRPACAATPPHPAPPRWGRGMTVPSDLTRGPGTTQAGQAFWTPAPVQRAG